MPEDMSVHVSFWQKVSTPDSFELVPRFSHKDFIVCI